jgi:hypothetical protein
MAVQSGSSELMGQFQQQLASMDAATREQNAAMFGLVGQVANSLRGVPVTQRGTALMAMAPQLQAAGVPDQEIQNYAQILSDPQSSDAVLEALSSRVLEAQSVFDAYAPQMQAENEVLSRFQNGQQVQGAVNPNATANRAIEQQNADTARINANRPRGALVNVNTGEPQLDPFQSRMAEQEASNFASFLEQAPTAQRNLARIDRLSQLLSEVNTGPGASMQAAMGRIGIPTEGLSEIQAAEALISAMIPDQRPPGSGVMSDADLELFRRSLPSLMNTRDGNQLIVETIRGVNEYDVRLGQIAQAAAAGQVSREDARRMVSQLQNPIDAIRQREGGNDRAQAVQITTGEEYSQLAPGTRYIDPNGVERIKQ